MVYNKSLPLDVSWRIMRVNLFEEGHSFAEIDALSVHDIGEIISVRAERARGEDKLKNKDKALSGNRGLGRSARK